MKPVSITKKLLAAAREPVSQKHIDIIDAEIARLEEVVGASAATLRENNQEDSWEECQLLMADSRRRHLISNIRN